MTALILRSACLAGLALVCGAARATPDYPLAKWHPSPNYYLMNRPYDRAIKYVVIHDMEGYYQNSIELLSNPARGASATYCIRSSDGDITQLVLHADGAWHSGNGTINRESIGIEHEGFASQYTPGGTYYPYTDVQYQASADLVRYICDEYDIPTDHYDTLLPGGRLTGGDPGHIFGHAQVPDPNDPTRGGGLSHHTDPGPYWDWGRYMQMIRLDATPVSAWAPAEVHPGQVFGAVLQFRNDANDTWANSGSYPIRLGTAAPQNRNSAFYTPGTWLASNRPKYLDNFGVARGGVGVFTLTLTAPMAYGFYREAFQPVMDTTPSTVIKQPIWFGEPAQLSIRVTPWDIVVDDEDAGFAASERWQAMTATDASGGAARYQPADAHEPAVFRPNVPVSGNYDVYAWWPASPENAPDAPFTIEGDAAPVTVRQDQRVNGGTWVFLARAHFAEGASGTVRLDSRAAGGRVVADAVRLAGPY